MPSLNRPTTWPPPDLLGRNRAALAPGPASAISSGTRLRLVMRGASAPNTLRSQVHCCTAVTFPVPRPSMATTSRSLPASATASSSPRKRRSSATRQAKQLSGSAIRLAVLMPSARSARSTATGEAPWAAGSKNPRCPAAAGSPATWPRRPSAAAFAPGGAAPAAAASSSRSPASARAAAILVSGTGPPTARGAGWRNSTSDPWRMNAARTSWPLLSGSSDSLLPAVSGVASITYVRRPSE
jgi:hypothetical protein